METVLGCNGSESVLSRKVGFLHIAGKEQCNPATYHALRWIDLLHLGNQPKQGHWFKHIALCNTWNKSD